MSSSRAFNLRQTDLLAFVSGMHGCASLSGACMLALLQNASPAVSGIRPPKDIARAVNKRLNLASKPFTNRALPWVVTVVLVFFSLVALVFLVRSTSEANAKAELVQREISSLNQQLQLIQKEAEQVKNALTAEQIQSLRSAHELVDRKRFSWSRLFADLEGSIAGRRSCLAHCCASGSYPGRTYQSPIWNWQWLPSHPPWSPT